MTWKTFHSRGETLRAVVDTADLRRDGLLPLDVDGVTETFGDDLSLLGALQLRWHTRLAGRIERELATQPMDLAGAVVRAWRGTADDNPGIHAILDHYTAEPTSEAMRRMLAVSGDKMHAMLAVSAGLSSLPATAATLRIGADLEDRARRDFVLAAPVSAAPVSFIGRIRAALAA